MKKSLFMFLFLMLIGVYFIIIGVLMLVDRSELLNNNASETIAVVTEKTRLRNSYSIYVEYVVEGVTYKNRLNILKYGTYIGEEVPIYYSANNPNNIMVKDSDRELNKFYYLILGMFMVFISLAYIPNRKRESKWK